MLSTTKKVIIVIIILIILIMTYKYNIKSNENFEGVHWALDSSGELCSTECGGGTRSRVVNCQTNDGKIVDNSLCPGEIPDNFEVCNTHPCGNWEYTDWSACPPCGPGEQTRSVYCKDIYGNNTENCPDIYNFSLTRECNEIECGIWEDSPWSTCSNICKINGETPTRTRAQPTCSKGEGMCPQQYNKPLVEDCNNIECGSYVTSDWDSCTVNCNGGTQTRTVTCEGGPCVDEEPPSSQICNERICGIWEEGEWNDDCSEPCNGGIKTRDVTCNSDYCDNNTKPSNSEVCNEQICGTWKIKKYNNCSVDCGGGIQTRRVLCEPDGSTCDHIVKPIISRSCNEHSCYTGDWIKDINSFGTCSSECGEGTQTYDWICSENGNCDPSLKPEIGIQNCNIQDCGNWIIDNTKNECSEKCGPGTQLFEYICDSNICDQDNKPLSYTQDCNLHNCPKWEIGDFHVEEDIYIPTLNMSPIQTGDMWVMSRVLNEDYTTEEVTTYYFEKTVNGSITILSSYEIDAYGNPEVVITSDPRSDVWHELEYGKTTHLQISTSNVGSSNLANATSTFTVNGYGIYLENNLRVEFETEYGSDIWKYVFQRSN